MKVFALVFLCFALSIENANAQRVVLASPDKQLALKAKALYEEGKYSEAIELLKQALEKNKNNVEANYYLALCYLQSGQDESALPYLEYYMANMGSISVSASDRQKALYRIHYLRERQKLLALPNSMSEPVKLSAMVNSNYPDYSPVMDATGKRLYFTSRRAGGISHEDPTVKQGDEDGYMTEKTAGGWKQAQPLPVPLNSALNEGVDSFSADGQYMIMTACGRENNIGNCDLYFAELQGDTWSTPQNFGNIVNSVSWDSQASISFDGNRIIFVSLREGGYGGEDLYMVERNAFGEWGPAMNLGAFVNTPFREDGPFFSQDGKTLYFSSEGHPGYGGMDIFKTVFENNHWSTPENMGRPLNTASDDRFFTIGGAGEKGYFSSNRTDAVEHIYEIDIPEHMRPQPTTIVTGTVRSKKGGTKVSAYILVEDLNTGELIALNKSNSASGEYLVVLPAGRTYSVSANKEGYFFYSQSFEVPANSKFQELRRDIELEPIEKGAKVVLNNVFFETGKSVLTPQSRLELEKAIELLRTNPRMVIEVGGHTDNVGDDATNMKLSHDRARSVRDYIVNAGIASERIQAKGYGELNPVASNDTEDGRKANRRTEFIILDY